MQENLFSPTRAWMMHIRQKQLGFQQQILKHLDFQQQILKHTCTHKPCPSRIWYHQGSHLSYYNSGPEVQSASSTLTQPTRSQRTRPLGGLYIPSCWESIVWRGIVSKRWTEGGHFIPGTACCTESMSGSFVREVHAVGGNIGLANAIVQLKIIQETFQFGCNMFPIKCSTMEYRVGVLSCQQASTDLAYLVSWDNG